MRRVADGATAAAGWFADPGGTPVLRYWNGAAWTPYISVPFDGVSPSAALAGERTMTTWVRRAWVVWPILIVASAWSTIESWASRGDHGVFSPGHHDAAFWVARDVLAIHEREIAARWLDREV